MGSLCGRYSRSDVGLAGSGGVSSGQGRVAIPVVRHGRLLRERAGEQFAAGVDVEALVEAVDVEVRGVRGDGEVVGDFLFGKTLHEEVKDLAEARREGA